MRRAIIQIHGDRVAFDGEKWSAVDGAGAVSLASILDTLTPELKRAKYQPDPVRGIAMDAAKMLKGTLVSVDPNPAAENAPDGLIY